jgi:cysteine/O-acetylserine efflux protein
MLLSIFWTMLGYMIICSFTPGPGNILALNTTTQGKRLILGSCVGYLCVQFLCTFAVYGLNDFLTPVLYVITIISTDEQYPDS